MGLLVCASAVIYGWISWLSWRFQYGSDPQQRPTLLTLALFGLLFFVYLLGIRLVRKFSDHRRCLQIVIAGSVVFRVTMLFSIPILEIDIYRYIWDGAATSAGVSPFLYSPEKVKNASSTVDDDTLQRLVDLRDHRPSLAAVLDRIHFAELPTVYPIVSQVVFALSDITTPEQASIYTRLIVMKTWLTAFDLATLWLVIKLLRVARQPVSLSIIYGWCPLLVKEIANSGHLDAIAVFFMTLTVYLIAKQISCVERGSVVPTRVCLATVVAFALSVGAKLYPIVIAPMLAVHAFHKIGLRRSIIWGGVGCLFIVMLLSPMTYRGTAGSDPGEGVKTFLQRWEMNDFLFLITVENLRPDNGRGAHAKPWFTVVPDSWRRSLAELAPPFLIARGVTSLTFLLIAFWIARTYGNGRHQTEDQVAWFLEGVFLTIAWFWLLAPTQNPWYWTWTLPLLPFAKNRAWVWISGIVFAYYLRFWFTDHFPDSAVLGTRYAGPAFFDFVFTWIEFAPWFLLLLFNWVRRGDPKSISDELD
ncbi:hypothetical protein Pla52n_18640 [Stieleria varia]|uniref:Glycosyltransferase RgtA/B/C/D-like domain-containing protein n=2 Tax=Stieleria varia TaxID=2528005 RepID=A0A5C6B6J4_9BACT|nr:hypothetical protein Pla52n_18640 [Stieleria varia]